MSRGGGGEGKVRANKAAEEPEYFRVAKLKSRANAGGSAEGARRGGSIRERASKSC